jgi:Ring finger domain/PITH domain
VVFLRQYLRGLGDVSMAMRGFPAFFHRGDDDSDQSDGDGEENDMYYQQFAGADAGAGSFAAGPDDDALVQQILWATADQELPAPAASVQAVEKLPRVRYTDALRDQFALRNMDPICPVCREDFEDLESGLLVRLPCAHFCCVACCERWLALRNTCPVCRFELSTGDPEYERAKVHRQELQAVSRRHRELESTGAPIDRLRWKEFQRQSNLAPYVIPSLSQILGVTALRPSRPETVLSDLVDGSAGNATIDDGRVLISATFSVTVSLHSLVIRASGLDGTAGVVGGEKAEEPANDGDGGTQLKLFAREVLDWADADEIPPTELFESVRTDRFAPGGEPIYVRRARFRAIRVLTVVETQADSPAPLLTKFEFWGTASPVPGDSEG